MWARTEIEARACFTFSNDIWWSGVHTKSFLRLGRKRRVSAAAAALLRVKSVGWFTKPMSYPTSVMLMVVEKS